MSGHSKWHNIKRQKEVVDQKKSKLFARLARDIISAAQGQYDPDKNAALRDAIARAKKANMPQANIDRLLQQKSGSHTQTTYEGFGPGGGAILILAQTDNPNRTVSEVRSILKSHGGRLGDPGSALWKFTQQLHITLPKLSTSIQETIELDLIDADIEDIQHGRNATVIILRPEQRSAALEVLSTHDIKHTHENMRYIATQPTTANEENQKKTRELIQELQDHPDIASVHSDTI